LLAFGYLLAFRGPSQSLRVGAATVLAGGYALLYGLIAGLGDETYTDIARVVYLFLPLLGLLAFVVVIPIVEIAGALSRSAPVAAFPWRHGLSVTAGLLGGWVLLASTGWLSPRVSVEIDSRKPPEGLARVRCEDGDTHLLTPNVVRRPSGMHLEVDNRTGDEIWVEYEIDGGANGGGGELVAEGVSEIVIHRAAQSIGVVCTHEGNGSPSTTATVALVPLPARLHGR
jgi:hypothetical protein